MQTTSLPATTVAAEAYKRLRQDVLMCRHRPGSKLKVDALAAATGFSSSPLRESLNRLVEEGLVQTDLRKGFMVTQISAADLSDIVQMRLMLDISALKASMQAGDDAWEANILAAFHRLEKVESRLPAGATHLDADWTERHRAFHAALLAACPSARQLAWCMSLFDQAERYRQFSAKHRQTGKRKDAEHRRLMQAVLQRDEDKACTLVAKHIQSTQRNVLAALTLTDGF